MFDLNRFLIIALATILMLSVQAFTQGLTVRVDHSKGAPRIMVNDKAVRARIFYGQPAAGNIPILTEGELIEYEFSPETEAINSATVHFRFGQTAGDVYLDDLSITDLTTGEKTLSNIDFENGDADFNSNFAVWPPERDKAVFNFQVEKGIGSNASSGIHIKTGIPPNGIWPDFHIYHNANLTLKTGHRYKVSFWAKATPERSITTAFYLPGVFFTYLGGPPGYYESQVKLAADAGVNFVSTSIPLVWPEPGTKENWGSVDSIIEATLSANPNALIIPRIGLYAPEWWSRMHPDEVMTWENGVHAQIISPASKLFQKEASERLALLIRHLEEKYPNNIAGYHPCGQNTGEWFYFDSWDWYLNGYSPCDTVAFRDWLKAKYKTDALLKEAWGRNSANLGTADVPRPGERHAAPDGVFRNPVSERAIIDFTEFQQDSMAESVCGFAKVVRDETKGKKLVLFFYGYVFEFSPMGTGAGCSGHYALRKVLNSPDIDILCSPISYFDRGRGQSGPVMTAAESVTLAKKMWLTEDDTRTHMTKESLFPGAEHVLNTADETNQLLLRNVSQVATRNFATWWMDLGATGWFDDPKLWAEMKRLNNLDEPLLQNPVPFNPEIAVVLDEGSMLRLAQGGSAVGRPGIYETRAALGRMGAPYGQYLMDDVVNGKVHAKLYIFVSAWKMDNKTREKLKKATKGSVCMWMYAPGYFDDYKKSLESMKQLTGFDLQPVALDQAIATPVDRYRQIGQPFGAKEKVSPLFAAKDVKAGEILAKYGDGSTAAAMRTTASGTSIFVGAPGMTADLLRFAARKAGAHLFTGTDCNVYANGPFLALHASKDGDIKVNTGYGSAVIDVLTGEEIGKGPIFTLPMKYSQTRILKIK